MGLLLLLADIYSYTRMQTNLFPEVLFPRITVIADAGQQPVDRMMITVTKPLLTIIYRKPMVALCFVLLLIGSGWYASTQLPSGFLPDLDEGTIVLDYHSPAGTDIDETDRLCRQMEKIILAHPDVETYSRRTALGMSFKTRPRTSATTSSS